MKLRLRHLSSIAIAIGMSVSGARANPVRVLCTTFPIYQITRNVTMGDTGTVVELLLPASLGCPHHYALTPQDMQKLHQADVLVINGLGMEEFLGAPLKKANPRLRIVDSSHSVTGLLPYAAACCSQPHDGKADCPHNDQPVNPHLFASPRQTAQIALNIAAALAQICPAGATIYFKNGTNYAERMNALTDEMIAVVRTLKNNRVVQPHGIFDYLARDIGLEVVAVMQPHGQEPSASEMLALIETIRAKNAGAIFTEPQYSAKVGHTLARELGLPVVQLDPGATGPDDAPLDYYEKLMRQNLEILRATLGPRP